MAWIANNKYAKCSIDLRVKDVFQMDTSGDDVHNV